MGDFVPPPPIEPAQTAIEATGISGPSEQMPLTWQDFVIFLVSATVACQVVFPLAGIVIYIAVTHVTLVALLNELNAGNAALSAWLQLWFDAGLLVPALLLVKLRHKAPLAVLGWRWPRWYWYLIAPLAAGALEIASNLLLDLQVSITKQVPTMQCLQIKSQYGHSLGIAIIATCIFAPFAEETVFRGFVFGYLRKVMPVAAAVVLSGLIFGIAHLDIQLLIVLSLLGCVLAVMYHYAKSIVPTMITHAIFNLIGIVLIITTPCGR